MYYKKVLANQIVRTVACHRRQTFIIGDVCASRYLTKNGIGRLCHDWFRVKKG